MQPTPQQKQWLRNHLNGLLHYSETCAEFYDHILTALEQHTGNTDFKIVVHNIIENDFGGPTGMAAIEWRYHNTTTADIQTKYWLYLKTFFSLRWLPAVIATSASIYWAASRPWFTSSVFMSTFLTLSLVASILSGARHIRTGFSFGLTKASVKDDGFDWMKKAPGVLFFVVILCNLVFSYTFDTTPIKNPFIVAIVFTLITLHTLVFYKIYKEQFKISFI